MTDFFILCLFIGYSLLWITVLSTNLCTYFICRKLHHNVYQCTRVAQFQSGFSVHHINKGRFRVPCSILCTRSFLSLGSLEQMWAVWNLVRFALHKCKIFMPSLWIFPDDNIYITFSWWPSILIPVLYIHLSYSDHPLKTLLFSNKTLLSGNKEHTLFMSACLTSHGAVHCTYEISYPFTF